VVRISADLEKYDPWGGTAVRSTGKQVVVMRGGHLDNTHIDKVTSVGSSWGNSFHKM
jgi:hypothetical protein